MGNKIRFLGHAAFQITTKKGKTILMDPWITQNPSCPVELDAVDPADIILITHDHFDHLGDARELSTKGVTISHPELLVKLQEDWECPPERFMRMNTGGTLEVEGIQITMVQAFHSSTHGHPVGFILTLEDGTTLYHAGDTGIFSSMALLGSLYPLDLALLPVGGVFTMDPVQAAKAVELLKPKAVIPMHYKTFPVLIADPAPFVERVKKTAPKVEVYVLAFGEEMEF